MSFTEASARAGAFSLPGGTAKLQESYVRTMSTGIAEFSQYTGSCVSSHSRQMVWSGVTSSTSE
jgi:hypothetical protein